MKKLYFALVLPFLILAVVSIPYAGSAHGEAGLTFSAVDTDNGSIRFVDIDYTETEIIARDSVGRFTFDLFADADRTQTVEYTDMWVRIVQDDGGRSGKTVFAGPIYPVQFGGAGFLFTFPDSGKYTLHVRYNDANKGSYGETLAEAEFPLDVLRSSEENTFDFGMEFWIGLIGGIFLVLILLLPIMLRKK